MSINQALPVLVLMPGLDGTGQLFAEFVREIGSTVEYLIVSYPKDQPMGYRDLEVSVLSALPKDRAFVLLGESFSGPLAIRLAARAPKGLLGLILCVTFAKNPYACLSWARRLMQYLPVKGLPRWVRAPLMWGSVSPSSAPSQMKRAMSGVSAPVVRRRIAELLAADETAALRQVQVPTLVLRARQDRVVSRRSSTIMMENVPTATLVEVDGPHLLLQTRPVECAVSVLNFLRALK